jgi:hypothetical protein
MGAFARNHAVRQAASDTATVKAKPVAARHSIAQAQRTAPASAPSRAAYDFSRIPLYPRSPTGLEADASAPRGDRVVQQRASDSGRPADKAFIREQATLGLAGTAQPLPYLDAIRRSFGRHAIDGVRAHVGGRAAAASKTIGALAYTVGDDIAFRQMPDLHTAAHEAAHVVQQRGGVQLDGGVGEVGDCFERNADRVANAVASGRSGEGLLDAHAHARGAAPGLAVQRQEQPIVTTAPKSAISIRDFIKLVELEEAKWPAAERTNTSLMITRLRKIFYGTPGWDQYLIPDAKDISPGYDIKEEVTKRENLSLIGPDAEIVRKRQVVKDAKGASPTIASQQEVRLEDGSFDDIGHVFAGLDAFNYPDPISAYGIASVEDNVAAVTWTGDLGSAVTEIGFEISNKGAAEAVEKWDKIVDDLAPAQDMLGDIDAYVMADQYNISSSGGKKVSELLRAYYLGAPSSDDGRAREHRYSRFCALTGLTGWTGSGFSNEKAWLDRWALEVAGAAALYYGKETEGKLAIAVRATEIIATQHSEDLIARYLLQNFLDALKTRVAAEPR